MVYTSERITASSGFVCLFVLVIFFTSASFACFVRFTYWPLFMGSIENSLSDSLSNSAGAIISEAIVRYAAVFIAEIILPHILCQYFFFCLLCVCVCFVRNLPVPLSPFIPVLSFFLIENRFIASNGYYHNQGHTTNCVSMSVCKQANADCKSLDWFSSQFSAKFHYYLNNRFLTNGLKLRLSTDESYDSALLHSYVCIQMLI